MGSRIDYQHATPAALQAMSGLERYVRSSGLEASLLELVKLRASQINRCGYCLDMHSKIARAQGETEQRIYVLSAWREAPFYTARERAALAWTEALTKIADTEITDALYDSTRAQFSEQELVDLTMAVITINGWNRLSISFGTEVGSYQRSPSAAAAR
jgi:AhpD family alkylhydroperoxidase